MIVIGPKSPESVTLYRHHIMNYELMVTLSMKLASIRLYKALRHLRLQTCAVWLVLMWGCCLKKKNVWLQQIGNPCNDPYYTSVLYNNYVFFSLINIWTLHIVNIVVASSEVSLSQTNTYHHSGPLRSVRKTKHQIWIKHIQNTLAFLPLSCYATVL